MNEIFTLLKDHKQDFPTNGSIGLIAFALYRGAIALPSQKKIIEGYFEKWRIPLKSVEYMVIDNQQPQPPGKGSIMVLHHSGKAYLFVEDKARDVVPKPSTGSSAAESSKASSK